MKEKFVYFIRPVGMQGPIKIGCSISPEIRCNNLLLWSPFDLEVVARLPGDEVLEARFHRKFLDGHLRFEWFAWSEELQETIAQVADGSFDIETLPPYSGVLRGMTDRVKDYTGIDYEYLLVHKRAREMGLWNWMHGANRLRAPHAFKKLSPAAKAKVLSELRRKIEAAA